MLTTKPNPREKKSNSSKKVHRRVVTESDELHSYPFKNQLKKTQKLSSKPKFIDVYSKYIPKQISTQRKQFKIYQNKPTFPDKHLKTQPDQIIRYNNVGSQKSKIYLGTLYGADISKTNIGKIFHKVQGEGKIHHHQFSGKLLKKESQIKKPQFDIKNRYQIEGVAGKGTFGVVYFGLDKLTGKKIAIKKVLQDKKYKNRQHQILQMLKHPNNLIMLDSYTTYQHNEQYLNIVMDYYSNNLYEIIKKKQINPVLLKIFSYQIFKGLSYLATLNIAHRDIKPQNILIDKNTHQLIISDFGSAKQLVKNQQNLAYICSRCYRAPELIFGATDYTTQIDMWSAGCVLVQMVNGSPPFTADSQVDQLIQIIKILGTPSRSDVQQMNKQYDMRQYVKFPKIKVSLWKNNLKTKDPQFIDLITKILTYSPLQRINPQQALEHPYFDQLKNQSRYQWLFSNSFISTKVKNSKEF